MACAPATTTTTRRDSETWAREMAQQAAGAPVTVKEAIQVRTRDEGINRAWGGAHDDEDYDDE